MIKNIIPLEKNDNSRYNILFAVLIFVFFFVFNSIIHPIIPIDLDDWSYIIKNRIFLPQWGVWNPAKVFPEYFYPLMSSIGAFVIYPLNNDYLQAQCIMHSIVISLSITVYSLSFLFFIRNRFISIPTSTTYLLSLLFLMLHFLIFRTEETNNIYMFYANNVNCYYNYTIPNLLCASLVFSLLSKDWLKQKFQPTFKYSILFVLLYLAIFSNLYSSIIFVGYIICNLLIDLMSCILTDKNYIHYLKTNTKKLIIVACWMLVHLFEAFGLRAKESYNTQPPLLVSIKTTLSNVTDIQISKVFLLLCLISAIFSLFFIVRRRNGIKLMSYQVIVTFLICFVYTVLLSSKVLPEYILGNHGNFPFFFYLILFVCITFAMIFQEIKMSNLFLPFVLLLLYSFINRTSNTFSDIERQYDYTALSKITRNNVNEIIAADKHNKKNIEITIPNFNNSDNWPLKLDLDYSNALYKHGIIKSYVKVKLIKGKNISEKNINVKSGK